MVREDIREIKRQQHIRMQEGEDSERLLESKYNLILMDCNMPEMDGNETTTFIRQMLYDNRIKQPIISACTGHSE